MYVSRSRDLKVRANKRAVAQVKTALQPDLYNALFEVLEQDRHALRRKLAATASEADSRLVELQADVRELQKAVEEREAALRSTEREKAVLVAELTEQNTRLAAQLKESNKTEEQLTAQLQGLRDQCNLRKSSLQDHVSSLEALRDEINMLTDKKAELERRLAALLAERDQLNALLDDANERIMLLERTTREQEMQLRQNRRELDEIRLVNSSLTSPSSSPLSLPHGLGHGHRSLLDEMECEDSSESGFVSTSELQSLKEEAVASYRQLRDLAKRLRNKDKDDSSMQGDSQSEPDSLPSVDENNCSKFKTGQLGEAVRDVTRLVGDLVDREGLEGEAVEVELHRAREDLDRTRRQLEERTDELKRRSDQVMDLTSKLSIREAELAGAQEERDRARADMDETHLAKDEVGVIVRKAWEVRDGAVARKNKVEVQLAKTRIDVLQANSQLMEAIQQKVELSQQLEQWQMDMQALLDEQMRRKLTTQEQRSRQVAVEASPEAAAAASDKKRTTSSLRLFSLFQR
ncbi:bicaudal D-related protein homolog isoform X1 [Thrips palmi]|uniref:Bicaudal D-related protein homolog isoform X1 n=1 Tax=Thrips palmi TaxID=161013 RepID=A0A6P9A226_THRPL|nr:bicaudal D-related protein homolog isoform X1 [Thrips palmi]